MRSFFTLGICLTFWFEVSSLELCTKEQAKELRHPTYLLALPQVDNDYLVSEQVGIIFQLKGWERNVVLNLSSKVLTSGKPFDERGLLSFAVDWKGLPEELFVCYSGLSQWQQYDHDLVVARYKMTIDKDNYLKADCGSEFRLLTIGQPGANNNGGFLFFGPPNDLLYITIGSGGGPQQEQDRYNMTSLLGKVLRINVSNAEGNYSIPDNNPFASPSTDNVLSPTLSSLARQEIFASGFWNPWRCSVDPKKLNKEEDNRIFCGDVGAGEHNSDAVLLLVAGGVYGCQPHCPETPGLSNMPTIPGPVLYTHKHMDGQALIGGPLYRGESLLSLQGKYLFADFIHKTLHSLTETKGGGRWNKSDIQLRSDPPIDDYYILGVVVDSKGDLLLLATNGLNNSVPSGKIYSLHTQCHSGSSKPDLILTWGVILPLIAMIFGKK